MNYLLILLFVKLNFAYFLSDSPCPDIPVFPYFDIEKIAGKWYMIAKYDNHFEQTADCNYGNYVVNDKTSLRTTDCELVNGTYSCFYGILRTNLAPFGARYSYDSLTDASAPTEDEFKVLSTDFTNYLAMYKCTNIDNGKSQHLFWLASRKPKLYGRVKTAVDYLMNSHFERKELVFYNQSSTLCEPRIII